MISQRVSIPFKRESVSKGKRSRPKISASSCFNSLQTGKRIQSNMRPSCTIKIFCFNSLQTGKRIQRRKGYCESVLYTPGFNSLQTGKRIQSVLEGYISAIKVFKVSIPFKRESVSKVGVRTPNSSLRNQVSIPFKRESVSKVK